MRLEARNRAGEVVGFVDVDEAEHAVTAYNLDTAPGNAGAATYLAAEVAKVAADRPIYVQVDIDNREAFELYARLGLEIVAVVMRRKGTN